MIKITKENYNEFIKSFKGISIESMYKEILNSKEFKKIVMNEKFINELIKTIMTHFNNSKNLYSVLEYLDRSIQKKLKHKFFKKFRVRREVLIIFIQLFKIDNMLFKLNRECIQMDKNYSASKYNRISGLIVTQPKEIVSKLLRYHYVSYSYYKYPHLLYFNNIVGFYFFNKKRLKDANNNIIPSKKIDKKIKRFSGLNGNDEIFKLIKENLNHLANNIINYGIDFDFNKNDSYTYPKNVLIIKSLPNISNKITLYFGVKFNGLRIYFNDRNTHAEVLLYKTCYSPETFWQSVIELLHSFYKNGNLKKIVNGILENKRSLNERKKQKR